MIHGPAIDGKGGIARKPRAMPGSVRQRAGGRFSS
jgi:hypothetical protein